MPAYLVKYTRDKQSHEAQIGPCHSPGHALVIAKHLFADGEGFEVAGDPIVQGGPLPEFSEHQPDLIPAQIHDAAASPAPENKEKYDDTASSSQDHPN